MILVIGATGNVGRHVVSGLLETGTPIRALTRDPGRADLPDRVEIGRGDLSIARSLVPALDGVDTVFLLWRQDSAQNPVAAVDVIAEHARRIVYLSSLTVRDEMERQTHPMSVIHADIEDAIERSGLGWTFLRAGKFATNTLGWADEIRKTGVVRLPFPTAGRSPIVARDIAAVAVQALIEDEHMGARYVLTGPEMLTEADQVRIIGEVTGRPLRCHEIMPEVARQEMLDEGVTPELADAALHYWSRLVTEPEPVTATVEEVTGAPATPFREWTIDHLADFR